jgi:hypothetical protein
MKVPLEVERGEMGGVTVVNFVQYPLAVTPKTKGPSKVCFTEFCRLVLSVDFWSTLA